MDDLQWDCLELIAMFGPCRGLLVFENLKRAYHDLQQVSYVDAMWMLLWRGYVIVSGRVEDKFIVALTSRGWERVQKLWSNRDACT